MWDSWTHPWHVICACSQSECWISRDSWLELQSLGSTSSWGGSGLGVVFAVQTWFAVSTVLVMKHLLPATLRFFFTLCSEVYMFGGASGGDICTLTNLHLSVVRSKSCGRGLPDRNSHTTQEKVVWVVAHSYGRWSLAEVCRCLCSTCDTVSVLDETTTQMMDRQTDESH